MKTRKPIITALNVSPIRAFQAFIADKNPHSFCGGGIKSPIPTIAPTSGSGIIDKPRGKEAATDETNDDSHGNQRLTRSPP
ncbi:MAG: hypothetical protein AB7U82_20520 [Blastocatellales bacterium]